MSIIGYYYLHRNGSLIFKRYLDDAQVEDFRESNFVVQFWEMDPALREHAWNILIEATALGAAPERIVELALNWACSDQDAMIYAEKISISLAYAGDEWLAVRKDFVSLEESPHGRGSTAIIAMAELAKTLGYKADKWYGVQFQQLVQIDRSVVVN